MTTTIHKLFAFIATTGAALSFYGTNAVAQLTGPTILCHPETQVVREGAKKVTFRVTADDSFPPYLYLRFTYQWQRQGPWATNFVNLGGATNNTYTIAK